MDDRRHVANKHLAVLLASHADEWPFSVSSKELISRLDELRMSIKPLKPTVLAVVLRLVDHVEPVVAVGEHHVLDSEVSIPKLA